VRANYLYAGVADVYAETGDQTLISQLHKMWNDVTQHKMYITGGCGSLYDGVSPDGTVYEPPIVQKVHQAYGRDYQLPNFTAHNETCANIGNVLWNWRMLQLEGDAKYADVMELALYNSVLSGISLDGKRFLYTNPLSYSDNLPFKQRWSKERVEYIKLSNCCPPNTVRTIAEVSNYAYSISDKGVYVNLYGSNNLSTKLEDGSVIKLTQQTEYPWEGRVAITVSESKKSPFSIFMRIPGWANSAKVSINGKSVNADIKSGQYLELNRNWKKGDQIVLNLPMEADLIESHPFVEETRNQIVVKRGPIVYCAESVDMPTNVSVFSITVPSTIKLNPKKVKIDNSDIVALEGEAILADNNWNNTL